MANNYSYLVNGKELNGDYMVKIGNGTPYILCYILNDMGTTVRREFKPMTEGKMDTKFVSFEELFNLNNAPGGREIVFEKLYIEDKLVREALELPSSEEAPEFTYTREDVKNILLNGTDDEVLDMYDFGPERMAEITKSLLVELGNISYDRLQLLEKIFKWNNISRMIENWKDADKDGKHKQENRGRRTVSNDNKKEPEQSNTRRRRAGL